MIALDDEPFEISARGVSEGVLVRDGLGAIAELQTEGLGHVGGRAARGIVLSARRAVGPVREILVFVEGS